MLQCCVNQHIGHHIGNSFNQVHPPQRRSNMKSNSTNSEKCIKRGETSDKGNEKCIKRSETSDKRNKKCIKRSEKVNKLLTQLEHGTKELFNSEQYQKYLVTFSKFTNYSINNTILIYLQNPNATLVAGYKAWETKFNRHVKQGEQGITILAPMKYKKDPDDEDSEVYIRFRTTAVFDISQTEGEELPSFSPVSIVKDVNGYQKLFTALAKLTDYKIEFAALAKDTCKGTCNFTTHTITIREGMSESENLSTLIHEIAHSILHEDEHNSRNQAEVEAESVAFVVSTFLGLDTSDYSFPYIVGWEENDVDLLRQSLQRIKTTSNSLITQLENELQNGTEQKSNEKEVKTKEEVKATQTMKLF